MNKLYNLIVFGYMLKITWAYSNKLYNIVPHQNDSVLDCGEGTIEGTTKKQRITSPSPTHAPNDQTAEFSFTFETIRTTTPSREDPYLIYQKAQFEVLLGSKPKEVQEDNYYEVLPLIHGINNSDTDDDDLEFYASGHLMHGELFMNKSAVHMPMFELIHRDHALLRLTDDYMQTAVDAFAIFVRGSVDDVSQLPASYILKSARTIAMMNIEKEKLVATWDVVKGDMPTINVTYTLLEMYRPLFKYLSGREIARLNMSDERILTYIGTHADLGRHQVGVVAAKYIRLNPNWAEPRYLNLMNNLLCGVPMTFMRKISESNFLQLTEQVFYHIRACDPIQRRFYLTMMTKTQALGKSYSWSARDVSRLGLLLTEVKGSELAAVNPEAMSGITSQVMLEIPPANLKYVTDMQLRYLGRKPMNILAKKLRMYNEKNSLSDSTEELSPHVLLCTLSVLFLRKV